MIMVAVSTHGEITAGENGKLSEIRTCHRINEDRKLNDTYTEQKTELITVKPVVGLTGCMFNQHESCVQNNSCSVRRNARTSNS